MEAALRASAWKRSLITPNLRRIGFRDEEASYLLPISYSIPVSNGEFLILAYFVFLFVIFITEMQSKHRVS